jgi:hypothetical protein
MWLSGAVLTARSVFQHALNGEGIRKPLASLSRPFISPRSPACETMTAAHISNATKEAKVAKLE